jgi:hypothetical protein
MLNPALLQAVKTWSPAQRYIKLPSHPPDEIFWVTRRFPSASSEITVNAIPLHFYQKIHHGHIQNWNWACKVFMESPCKLPFIFFKKKKI